MPVVTLTTDFGTADGYVAAMKGVILGIAPQAQLVDVTHAIPPQDVRHGAYVIYAACPYFPRGTVHLGVVDPGVGGPRRALAIQTSMGRFVGPDNGLFSYVLQVGRPAWVVEVAPEVHPDRQPSPTFHGRDVFAPAAARLALGVPVADIGRCIDDPVVFTPRLSIDRGVLEGEVLHIDRFGNLVTSIGWLVWSEGLVAWTPAPWATPRTWSRECSSTSASPTLWLDPRNAVVEFGGRRVGVIRRTYCEAAPGEILALVGSGGHLELAVRDGSAAALTGLVRGARVSLWYSSAE